MLQPNVKLQWRGLQIERNGLCEGAEMTMVLLKLTKGG
jgi:hypothetical protein